MSTWRTYEAAKKERKTLPPLTIKGQKFVFPAEPMADFDMGMSELIVKYKGQIPDSEALALVPILIGDDELARLRKVTTGTELGAIVADLLREYGYAVEGTEEAPLAKGKKRASRKPSSRTGGRSKQTFTASTESRTSARS